MHDTLKDAQLDGLDISFDAAPPTHILPPGVTLRHWDIKGNVPEDLVGVYDIVNVRFLAYVILNDEVPGVVEKLFSLLSKSRSYLLSRSLRAFVTIPVTLFQLPTRLVG